MTKVTLNKNIVALPVDGRPVVRSQVQLLAQIAGCQLTVPDITALGHFRTPADRNALADWLIAHGEQADGFVLSLDMLVYGGLVPSRFITDDLSSLQARLALVTQLKTRWPHKPIYAFAATMRMSNNNYNEEEKLYWAQYGELIWRWSYYTDRHEVKGEASDLIAAQTARSQIPDDIAADYLATRQRNFAVTRAALKLTQEGLIDRMILPQDDTAEYGCNIAERRLLEQALQDHGLSTKVLIYPGADEVIHTLTAHLCAHLLQRPPLKVFVSCGEPLHVKQLRALYEDRPVQQSIASQVNAVGAVLVDEVAQADVVLAVHTRGTGQGDWAMRKPLPQPVAIDLDWLESLRAVHTSGKPIAVVDLAYANGGDPDLVAALASTIGLGQLAGYAGWNTASNSLGSLLAQLIFQFCTDKANSANRQTLVLRLLEDFFYQAHMRQVIRDQINEPLLSASELNTVVSNIFTAPANAWAAEHKLGWQVTQIAMPWNRTFEIDIQLQMHD